MMKRKREKSSQRGIEEVCCNQVNDAEKKWYQPWPGCALETTIPGQEVKSLLLHRKA
jgi:hypothetical protein